MAPPPLPPRSPGPPLVDKHQPTTPSAPLLLPCSLSLFSRAETLAELPLLSPPPPNRAVVPAVPEPSGGPLCHRHVPLSSSARRIEPGAPQSTPPSRTSPPPAAAYETIAPPSGLPVLPRPLYRAQGELMVLAHPSSHSLPLSFLLTVHAVVLRRGHGRRRNSGDHLVQAPLPLDSARSSLAVRQDPGAQFCTISTNS